MENVSDQLLGQSVLQNRSNGHEKSSPNGCYENSLIGEYARILLLLVTLPLLVWLGQLANSQHVSVTSLIAATVLLATLVTTRGNAWFRVILLVLMTFNIFSVVINPDAIWASNNETNPLDVPNRILLICLTLASLFEIGGLFRKNDQPISIKFLWWVVLAIPALGYIVGCLLYTSDAADE